MKIKRTCEEKLNDEVSENTLKKRREYYRKHGVKNVFPPGLGSSLGEGIENDSSLSYNDGGGEDMSDTKIRTMSLDEIMDLMCHDGYMTPDEVIAAIMELPDSPEEALQEDMIPEDDSGDFSDGVELLYRGFNLYKELVSEGEGSLEDYKNLYKRWRTRVRELDLSPSDWEAFSEFIESSVEGVDEW